MTDSITNSLGFHVQTAGSGPRIRFAHGLMFDSTTWAGQLPHFKRSHQCITLDFPGHGKSPTPREQYDLQELSTNVARLIEELKLAPLHFVGHSLGGMVGLQIATQFPKLLTSLSLIASTAGEEPPERVAEYRKLAFVSRWITPRLVLSKVLPLMFGQEYLDTNQASHARIRQQLIHNSRRGIYLGANAVIGRRAIEKAALANVNVPVLCIIGEKDTVRSLDEQQRICASVPDAKRVVIPKAPHMVHVTHHREVNRELAAVVSPTGPQAA